MAWAIDSRVNGGRFHGEILQRSQQGQERGWIGVVAFEPEGFLIAGQDSRHAIVDGRCEGTAGGRDNRAGL